MLMYLMEVGRSREMLLYFTMYSTYIFSMKWIRVFVFLCAQYNFTYILSVFKP